LKFHGVITVLACSKTPSRSTPSSWPPNGSGAQPLSRLENHFLLLFRKGVGQQVNNETAELEPNDVLFMGEGHLYAINFIASLTSGFYIHIDITPLPQLFSGMGLIGPPPLPDAFRYPCRHGMNMPVLYATAGPGKRSSNCGGDQGLTPADPFSQAGEASPSTTYLSLLPDQRLPMNLFLREQLKADADFLLVEVHS
jgi:hypothetical protein